jgi:hypothetical protein
VLNLVGRFNWKFANVLLRYTPWIGNISLEQGLSFKPTLKALPTFREVQDTVLPRLLRGTGKERIIPKVRFPFVRPYEFAA